LTFDLDLNKSRNNWRQKLNFYWRTLLC